MENEILSILVNSCGFLLFNLPFISLVKLFGYLGILVVSMVTALSFITGIIRD